ncbi:MAG TPA: hypothetical protein VGM12_22440 [Trebonia sp.]|jgi:hypothetical protein
MEQGNGSYDVIIVGYGAAGAVDAVVVRGDGLRQRGGRHAQRAICSNSYISGLSLADCIFSGRRAGLHAGGKTHAA